MKRLDGAARGAPCEQRPVLGPQNALTIDVEDYFHVSGFQRDIGPEDWGRFEPRIEANTYRLLELLEEYGVQATFFVLGWVAERFGKLVRDIYRIGHEIGCHSYWHRLVYTLSPVEFRADVQRSRDVLQAAIGAPVTAYRAPSFSITERSRWALEILVQEGFRSDSSIFPIHHDRYGIPNAPLGIHRLQTPSGGLWEFPPSVVKLGPLNLPVGGGGYFRLLPLWWTCYGVRRIHREGERPVLFYLHPWEIDPAQPRLSAGSRAARWRHYINLKTTQRKLETLLGQFRFTRMCDVLQRAGAADQEAAVSNQSMTI